MASGIRTRTSHIHTPIWVLPAGDVTTGLVSYWPFNDGGGTTFVDTQSGYNGTVHGTGAWGSGYITWNGGVGDWGEVTDKPAFNVGSTITVFGWINCPTGQTSTALYNQYDFGNNERAWALAQTTVATDHFRVIISDDGTSNAGHIKNYEGSVTVFDSTWHSIAFRFNSGVLDLFTDGVKDLSVNKVNDDAITQVFDSTASIAFFAFLSNGSPNTNTIGSSQRVRLYNIAKTDADIAAMHALGHA